MFDIFDRKKNQAAAQEREKGIRVQRRIDNAYKMANKISYKDEFDCKNSDHVESLVRHLQNHFPNAKMKDIKSFIHKNSEKAAVWYDTVDCSRRRSQYFEDITCELDDAPCEGYGFLPFSTMEGYRIHLNLLILCPQPHQIGFDFETAFRKYLIEIS